MAFMTGPDHYRRAQELLASVDQGSRQDGAQVVYVHPHVLLAAIAHAIQGMTAATADLAIGETGHWRMVLEPQPSTETEKVQLTGPGQVRDDDPPLGDTYRDDDPDAGYEPGHGPRIRTQEPRGDVL